MIKYLAKHWNSQRLHHRTMFFLWERLCYVRRNPEWREVAKLEIMGGDSGRWQEAYNTDVPQSFLSTPLYRRLDEILNTSDESYTVIQIGAARGRELKYFARKYPQHAFIATDIVPADGVVKLDVHDIKDFVDKYENVIVFCNGVIQYIQPEYIEKFFRDTRYCLVLALETGLVRKCGYRENFTWSHDYQKYIGWAHRDLISIGFEHKGRNIGHIFLEVAPDIISDK